MPIKARKLIVVILNVDAVASTAIFDKPVTADVAPDEYRMFLANTVRRDVISIPPIRQSSAAVTAIDTPNHAKVVFIWVRARGHAHTVFDVPTPAVRPAVVLAHPVQMLAPAQEVFFSILTKQEIKDVFISHLTVQNVSGGTSLLGTTSSVQLRCE